MNGLSHRAAETEVEARAVASGPPRRTRPFYWSVRRELWENRSVYLAPAGVAAFAVAALVIHAITMPSHMPGLLANDPANPQAATGTYRTSVVLVLATMFIVGAFYSLEALSAERRDRGILFWKSLPVSDRTTVLAKACVPLVILPLVSFAAVVAMHLTLLLLSFVALLIKGHGIAPLWNELQLPRLWGMLVYASIVITLWHAPVYGFLLLVSGWARRTAVLWAVLPLLALAVLEKLTMDTLHVASWVVYRLVGWYGFAFAHHKHGTMPFAAAEAMTPARFLALPGLWMGLALAAAFIFAAIRLRRRREPG